MGSDDESVSDAGSRHTAGSALDSVPVDISGDAVAKLRCKLCNSKATEMSPMAQSSDMYTLHLEWRLCHKKKIRTKSYQSGHAANSAPGAVGRFIYWGGMMNLL